MGSRRPRDWLNPVVGLRCRRYHLGMSKGSPTVKAAWIGFAAALLAAVIALWPKVEPPSQSNSIEQKDSARSVVFQGNQTGNSISIDQSTKESQIGSIGANQGVVTVGNASNRDQGSSISNTFQKGEVKP
jgi:hypothetical protein